MKDPQRMGWAIVIFPLAALCSALVTVCWRPRFLGHEDFLGSIVFGVLTAICFYVVGRVRSIWKAAVFVVISAIAPYVAFVMASISHDYVFRWIHSGLDFGPELFVGGFVGALLILAASRSLFFYPRPRNVLLKSLFWAFAGGLLGFIGWLTAPLFTPIRMRLAPHNTDSDVSVIFVWQIGMGFVLALMCLIEARAERINGHPNSERGCPGIECYSKRELHGRFWTKNETFTGAQPRAFGEPETGLARAAFNPGAG